MHVYEGAPKFSIDPSHSLRMCVILSFFCILAHYFDVSCFSFWGLYCFSISSIWLHFYDFFPSFAAPISVHTVHFCSLSLSHSLHFIFVLLLFHCKHHAHPIYIWQMHNIFFSSFHFILVVCFCSVWKMLQQIFTWLHQSCFHSMRIHYSDSGYLHFCTILTCFK